MITSELLPRLSRHLARSSLCRTGVASREHLLDDRDRGPMEKAFLTVLFEVYPKAIQKGEILGRTGYASSGPVSKTFAKLVALGWAKAVGRGELRAVEEFGCMMPAPLLTGRSPLFRDRLSRSSRWSCCSR